MTTTNYPYLFSKSYSNLGPQKHLQRKQTDTKYSQKSKYNMQTKEKLVFLIFYVKYCHTIPTYYVPVKTTTQYPQGVVLQVGLEPTTPRLEV